MKIIETIQHNNTNTTLTVMVEEIDEGKGTVSYFINGYEVQRWEALSPLYKRLFTALADNACEVNQLTKWSY